MYVGKQKKCFPDDVRHACLNRNTPTIVLNGAALSGTKLEDNAHSINCCNNKT